MRSLNSLWLTLLVSTTQSSLAQPQYNQVSKLRLNYSTSTSHLDDESGFTGIQFDFNAKARFSRQWQAQFEALFEESEYEENNRHHIKQAFIKYRAASFDISAGKQIFSWGKANAINPVDVVTPRDYTISRPFLSDQRSGVESIKVDYYATPTFSTTVAAIWKHEPSTIHFPGNEQVDYIVDDSTNVNTASPQWVLRTRHYHDDLDWSLYYYRGHNLLPEAFRTNQPDNQPYNPSIHFQYPEVRVAGFDLNYVFGRNSLKMEFATNHPTANNNNFGMPSFDALVVGLSHHLQQYLILDIQWTTRYSKDDSLNNNLTELQQHAMQLNKFIYQVPKTHNSGMTIKLENQWLHETLFAEWYAHHHFVDNSTFEQLIVTYRYRENIKLTLSNQRYHGEKSSLYGSLKKNQNTYFEIQYTF
jgi:hypothetical protein